MKYSLAIFDLDGTILDTLVDLCDAVNHALTASCLDSITREQARSYVGNGIEMLLRRSAPGADECTVGTLLTDFSGYYREHCADKTKPFDGIEKELKRLKASGVALALVSNKPDSAVKKLCGDFFPEIFAFTVGEREGIKRKPSPDSVCEAMRALGFRREETVYIGDSEVDIETAENAGTDCISVDWGFRDREKLREAGAKLIISSPEKLADTVLGIRTDHSIIAGNLFLEGYNCSQSVLLAFSDVTGLDRMTALHISSSFGGGMGRMREVCGAVSGMLMVAGILWGYDRPGDNEVKCAHYARVQTLAGAFRKKHGSIICREILKCIETDSSPVPTVRDAEFYKKRPCLHCIEDAAAVLDDMITQDGAGERNLCTLRTR